MILLIPVTNNPVSAVDSVLKTAAAVGPLTCDYAHCSEFGQLLAL